MNPELEALAERWPLCRIFDLKEDSTVVIVGAYKGLAMELIHELYNPAKLVGFEPQKWAAEEASHRIRPFSASAYVYSVGLGIEDGQFPMGEWHTDACSFINTGPGSRDQGFGTIVEADWYLRSVLRLNHIDLMIMNIEAYEYTLLPFLRDKGWLEKIDKLAVQWHLGLGSEPKSYDDIADEVDKIESTGLKLVHDERPAWTYHVRNND